MVHGARRLKIHHRDTEDAEGRYFTSFRRKSLDRLGTLSLSNGPESRINENFWTPAFAGVTALMASYEAAKTRMP
jgi:hypothetical protein